VVRPPDPTSLERPWIGAYPPGVPPTYRLPEVALSRLLDDAARDFPDRPALVADGAVLDHAELRDRVDQITTALAGLGVRAGDRVLLAVPNGITAPTLFFACWRLGAVVVPVAPELPVERLQAILTDAGASAVLGTPGVVHDLAQHGALPGVAVVVTGQEWPKRGPLERLGRVRRGGRSRRRASREGASSLADLLVLDGVRSAPPPPAPDTPALLAYRPRARELRGVVLTHANLVANAFQARLWVPDVQAGRERVLVADPLHEPLPLTLGLLAGILSAATLILLDHPDPSTLARAIERERPTLLPVLPARLADLLTEGDVAKRDLGSVRVCLAGGAPLDPHVASAIEGRTGGARVREVYGLAEAGALTHAQPVYGRSVPTSMGLPVTGTVAVVVDPDDHGRIRAPGEAGMLLVTGPQIARGYWHRDDETATTFHDGWVVTGDLVTVDEAGVFQHVGRVDEVVERQGQLVSPRRVEAALERHPAVRRAGVVASGDLLLAAVVSARRSRPDPEALLAHCRAVLEPPAVPDHVTLVDALPETDAGDLARDELRHELAGR
jgi:long-chain acyl-CoA synthetase